MLTHTKWKYILYIYIYQTSVGLYTRSILIAHSIFYWQIQNLEESMHKRQFFQASDRTLFGYNLKTWSHSLRFWAEVHQYLNVRQQLPSSGNICLHQKFVWCSMMWYRLKVFSWRSKVTWKRSKVHWDIILGCRTMIILGMVTQTIMFPVVQNYEHPGNISCNSWQPQAYIS